jgi:hypothetical protein
LAHSITVYPNSDESKHTRILLNSAPKAEYRFRHIWFKSIRLLAYDVAAKFPTSNLKGYGMKPKRMIVLGTAISFLILTSLDSTMAAPKCDRQCLVNMMQRYVAAMVKHDPKAVPLAENVKFMENAAAMPIGKGLWETASGGPTAFQIYAADPLAQSVACLLVMKENDKDIMLGAHLKIVNGKISEADQLVARDNVNGSLPALQEPRPMLVEDVAPADRMDRGELIKIGLSYYDALTGEDGTFAPFADDCERHENGAVSASTKPPERKELPAAKQNPELEKMMKSMAAIPRTCEAQISAGVFAYITEINPRRLVVADVQKGLAVGISMFQHDGHLKTLPIKGVPGMDSMPGFTMQFNFPSIHFFKIMNGKIYDIETIGVSAPFGTKFAW